MDESTIIIIKFVETTFGGIIYDQCGNFSNETWILKIYAFRAMRSMDIFRLLFTEFMKSVGCTRKFLLIA